MAISVTSIFCAFLRGFHSYYDSTEICDDSFALQIIPEERIQLIRKGFTSVIPNVSEQCSDKEIDAIISSIIKNIPTTAQVLSRTYYCEKELELFLEKGNSQYIILGAGLDTYSLRYNNSLPIKIFEIDQEDTQCFKKEQIYRIKKELPKIQNIFVLIYLILNCQMYCVKSSFEQNKSVLVSALGLIMYLSIDSINDLFKSLSKICLAGSLVVFDYFDDTTFDETKSSEDFKKWIKQGKLTGEQFRSCLSYDDLVSIANTNSFTVKTHLSPDEISGEILSRKRSNIQGM